MFRRGRNKYNAVKITINGETFDSKKEYSFYQILKEKESRGEIILLQRQVPFIIQHGFNMKIGTGQYYSVGPKKLQEKLKVVSFRPITYIADFIFFDKSKERFRIIDCKGMKTETYLLKKKMFNFKFLNEGYFIEENI